MLRVDCDRVARGRADASGGSGPDYFGAEAPPLMALPRVDRAIVAEQLQGLAEAEQVPGVKVEALVVEAPEVYREILVHAERLGSDLVVMGTHGRSGFERLFLGSTAEKVLRKAQRVTALLTSRSVQTDWQTDNDAKFPAVATEYFGIVAAG
jgi:nucleotide-binding universal stress UspA family protein